MTIPPVDDRLGAGSIHRIQSTLGLTEALEKGELSSDEYTRARMNLIGDRPDLVRNLLVPILDCLWESCFPVSDPEAP